MKRIFLLAMAAATMVACSQNEEIENAAQKAKIEIGTVVKAGTKAAVTTNSSFDAFTVSAYTVTEANILDSGVGAAYMNQVDYKKGSGTWAPLVTTDVFYWPLNEEMHFFAYPTASKNSYTAGATGYPSLSFTVGAIATDQTDLVVAHAKVSQKPAGGKLTLNFKHVLTRINFSYKPEKVDYTYDITKVTVNGVAGGTAVYTFNNSDGAWGIPETASVNYDYPIAIGTTADKDGFYALGAADASLMLFPQDVVSKTISITYTTSKDDHTYFNGTKNVTLPEGAMWGMGQNIRYKLTLPLGAEGITFDTVVEDPVETPETGTPA